MLQRSRAFRVVGLLSLCFIGKAMWAQGNVSASVDVLQPELRGQAVAQ